MSNDTVTPDSGSGDVDQIAFLASRKTCLSGSNELEEGLQSTPATFLVRIVMNHKFEFQDV